MTYLKKPVNAEAARAAALVGNPAMNRFAALLPFSLAASPADYVDVCPIDIDRKAMERGHERFNIFCAVCHDALGTGNGKIVERGYLRPPNYHTDYSRGFERRGVKLLLRDAPIGYYFEVITRGFGGMPDYASQIPPDDRWKIIAYIRALQRSQWTPLRELSERQRTRIRQELPLAEERP
jgi:mono/diheme cytochrome c family protein